MNVQVIEELGDIVTIAARIPWYYIMAGKPCSTGQCPIAMTLREVMPRVGVNLIMWDADTTDEGYHTLPDAAYEFAVQFDAAWIDGTLRDSTLLPSPTTLYFSLPKDEYERACQA